MRSNAWMLCRWGWLGGLAVALFLVLARPAMAQAGETGDENRVCLTCHATPNLQTTLPSGEILSLYVNPDTFNASVHGQQGQKCTACHTNITGYPHPPLFAKDRRDLSIGYYTTCRQCHGEQFQKTLDSVHARELAAGNRNAPICTDCHGYHDVQPVAVEAHFKIPLTCSKCHSTIYNEYKESVHGAALLEERNPDVPTCIDCHGVHSIEDPLTARFRLNSPQMCAHCHTDTALMSKYGLTTDVLRSYVSEFHGTTVVLFAQQSPDQEINAAVCFDCHGIHNIKKVTDPEATVVKENLLATCRQCHPDATADFPAAWVGHYAPSPERHPLVYYVNLFYQFLIPAVIGFFIVFNGLDMARSVVNRLRRRGE